MNTTLLATGATGGIGRAVVETFAGEGARVVIGGRDGEAIERTAAEVDGQVRGLRTDVRDEFDLERLAETAARFGPGGIDVVVPCAAVYHGDPGETPLSEEPYASFDDTLRTNVRGVFATVRESLPHMPEDGRVVVPSGSVAREGKPGYGAYAVSKAGAEAVSRGFAADCDQTVGVVDPGVVATELTGGRGRDPADAAEMIRWAAVDLDAADLDGTVLSLRDWKTATS
jgi:NAD(P)-dependent dehydrogenase (short-subunit alcohol dehydrogenase family)